MKNKTLIPQVLREHRLHLKLSAEEVVCRLKAHGIEISEKTLYGYENGVSSPKINTFLCLCDIYGIKNIMAEFGYHYGIASGDNERSLDMYNDFFDAPILDKLFLLIKNGVPSFNGYEEQLNSLFPNDSVAANFNRLSNTFCGLSEGEQDTALFLLDELSAHHHPNITKSELDLITAYRKADSKSQSDARHILGAPPISTSAVFSREVG